MTVIVKIQSVKFLSVKMYFYISKYCDLLAVSDGVMGSIPSWHQGDQSSIPCRSRDTYQELVRTL